jgi:hypothetical protein
VRAARHLALLLACVCLPASAQAATSVHLAATLSPERLGRGTTIGFTFQIGGSRGAVPPPLTAIDLRYPQDLGIALSGLGLETCAPALLQAVGPLGCPRDSLMGLGSALAEIPIGEQVVTEPAEVKIVRGPTEGGRLALLIHANGRYPVNEQIVFPAVLVPARAPFGGELRVSVPLVPSVPGAPDLSIVRLQATLGPQGITYTERVGDTVVVYRPRGILLPDSCPRGGFPFAAAFRFQNGTSAHARTAVPCPRQARVR